jgi:hypothetical protein
MDNPDGADAPEQQSRARTNADGSVTWPLFYPIDSENSTLSEITLRRVKGADLQAAETITGNVSRQYKLISLLANIPQASIRKLDAADIAGLAGVLDGFLGTPPATGGASS